MEEARILRDLVKIEYDLGLYNQTIYNVPIWRIVRYRARLYYINKRTGYTTGSPTEFKTGSPKPKMLSGFWSYIGKKKLSIFFPFNRLANINGEYFDKFVDPVIDESGLSKSNYVIVDPGNYCGSYSRVHRSNTISDENRTVSFLILKFYYRFLTPIKYGKEIKALFYRVQKPLELPNDYIKRFYKEIGSFIASYKYYNLWFGLLKPKRVFVVLREGYFPQIAVCKNKKIPVAEFQHGINLSETITSTGKFDIRIDPDYFLVFGEFWKGITIGKSKDRIICIGWAYKDLLQKKIDVIEKKVKRVLVVSSTEITNNILETLIELSKTNLGYGFDIRLHPCESLTENQKNKIKNIPNTQVVDNRIDSAVALLSYKYVIGENSSVIYEALSVGCRVGMLNMCGLRPAIDHPGIKDNFFIINNCDDFERFLSEDLIQSTSKAEFYSDFDSKRFMDFIETKM